MNKTTSRILIYAVIFLAVLNIATFSTIGYHIYQSNRNANLQSGNVTPTKNYNGRYFRDRLKLDADQMDRFRGFNQEFRTKARNINSGLELTRDEMLREMAKDVSDTGKLTVLSDSIGQLHKELKISTYKYYLNIKQICNKEQSAELNSIFQEFFIGNEYQHRKQNRERQRKGRRETNTEQ